MSVAKYHRILLKVGGEALTGGEGVFSLQLDHYSDIPNGRAGFEPPDSRTSRPRMLPPGVPGACSRDKLVFWREAAQLKAPARTE